MTIDASTEGPRGPPGRDRADGRRTDHHVDPGSRSGCAASSSRGCGRPFPTGNDAEVVDLTSPESNGMSSETLLVTARWNEEAPTVSTGLVARVEPPATDYPVFTTYDLDMQFRVMRLVSSPHRCAGARDPLVRAGSRRARRIVLRHGPGRRAGAPRRPALHLRRQLGLRRHRSRPADHPGVGHPGHGRHPLDHRRPTTTSASSSSTSPGTPPSSAASTTGRHTTSGWSGTAVAVAGRVLRLADGQPPDRRQPRCPVLG